MKKLLITIVFLILSLSIVLLFYQNALLKRDINRLVKKNFTLSQHRDNNSNSLYNLRKEVSSIKRDCENEKYKMRKYLKSVLPQNSNTFIPDIVPINGDYIVSQKFSKKHPAYDLAAEEGTEVIASASGFVYQVDNEKYFGKTIVLEHLNGYKTKYAHLARILIKENQFTEKGKVIGLVGSSGRSTAPHLHFEIIKDTLNIDPNSMIKGIGNAVIQK